MFIQAAEAKFGDQMQIFPTSNFPGKMKMVSKLYTLQPHHVMWKLGEKTAPVAEVPHGSLDIGLDVGFCFLIHV